MEGVLAEVEAVEETGLTLWEGTDEVLAQMEQRAFVLHRFEVPIGSGGMHAVRHARCCRCGAEARRSELDLSTQARTFFCEACR